MFGVASLLLASLYLFGQRDIKRMLAYSSVEHMGILAIGVSFGAPDRARRGAAARAGARRREGQRVHGRRGVPVKYGTKQMSPMRDGLRLLPWSGPLFLLAVFALSALPPFGIFRSEFEIVAGGLDSGGYAAAAVLVVLVTVAFFGLAASATGMLLTPRRARAPPRAAGPGGWNRNGARRARHGSRRRGEVPGAGSQAADAGRAQRLDGRPGAGRARGPDPARGAPARRADRPDHPGGAHNWGRAMTVTSTEPTVAALWEALAARVARGERFAGLFAARGDGGVTLSAYVAGPGGIDTPGGAAAARAADATRRSPR